MGLIIHQAIIVTNHSRAGIDAAHQAASRIFMGFVSEPVPSLMNGYWSFFVPPDGSKEGWDDSNEGDRRRAEFTAWLREHYSDEHTNYKAVEVSYGETEVPHLVDLLALDDEGELFSWNV